MADEPKKNEVVPSDSWTCITCKTGAMTHKEMIDHLKNGHGLDPKKTTAQRKLRMHMDGTDWFGSDYDITITKDDGSVIEMVNSVICKC